MRLNDHGRRRCVSGRSGVLVGVLVAIVTVTGAGFAAPAEMSAPAAPSASAARAETSAAGSAPSGQSRAPVETSASPVPTPTSPPAPATTVAPTELQSAECYFTADPTLPDNSTGVAFGYKEGEGYDNTVSVDSYLDACHQSLVRGNKITEADPVTACVLVDGRVGVFPGIDDTCAAMGLPVALRTASAPIQTA